MRVPRPAIALALLVLGVGAGGPSSAVPRGTLAVVAEAAHESGGVNYPSDVYVVDADGGHVRNLTHDGASNGVVNWMPDGRRIVFQSRPSDPKHGASHIFVIGSDGTGRRRLTSRIGGSFPAVSPDGRRIAFVVVGRRRSALYVMDSDGRHERHLRTPHEEWDIGSPSWSADGRVILFARSKDGILSLFVVRGDGSGVTRLERSDLLNGFAWSPTGRTLAVDHSDPAAAGEDVLTIADLRLRHGRFVLRPVKKLTGHLWPGAFRWTVDGRRIAYESSSGVWTVDARRPGPPRRFPVHAYVYNLAWSPGGRWFAFSPSRDLVVDPIEVAATAGGTPRTVTRRICCLLDQIAWAPR